jgi:pimeloyl-ACP methyl ester carboxylesterase
MWLKRAAMTAMLAAVWVSSTLTASAQQGGGLPQLIGPDGPYAVGRTAYAWNDTARPEIHTPDETDTREILVEVWYPAAPDTQTPPGTYLDETMANAWALQYQAPAERLQALRANALPDAPLAADSERFPVLIFDPGFSVMPRHYTVLLEQLASQGYIVFAVSHPYVTLLTVFPDGHYTIALSDTKLRDMWKPRDYFDAIFQEVWVPDIQFVLGQIDQLNADDPQERFTGRLALDQLGMIGHSMGGRTLSQVCLIEPRCAGMVNLDGGYSAEVELTLNKPYMMILADNGVDQFVAAYKYSLEAIGSDYYVLMIPGTHHMSFSDMAFWMPLALDKLPMTEDQLFLGQVALIDYRAYIAAFFDQYLRQAPSPLLEGPSDEHPFVFYLERETPIDSPIANAQAMPASLVKGDNLGEIAVGEADVWTYAGTAGEVLSMQLKADRPAGNATTEQRLEFGLLDTLLVVRAPDGSLLAANDDTNDTDTDSTLRDVVLPEDGEYQIEVRSWGSQSAGAYTLLIDSSLAEK